MSISFSRKTTFTSFTFTSSEDLAAADSIFGKGKFIWQIRDQYYKGGIVVRKHAELQACTIKKHGVSRGNKSSNRDRDNITD